MGGPPLPHPLDTLSFEVVIIFSTYLLLCFNLYPSLYVIVQYQKRSQCFFKIVSVNQSYLHLHTHSAVKNHPSKII